MKTSATSGIAGRVLPAFYPALAQYVLTFVRAYAAQGAPIDAITPQNEPEQGAGYPGMIFPATAAATFITTSLGSASSRPVCIPASWRTTPTETGTRATPRPTTRSW